MKMEHILCPVDYADSDRLAIDYAATLAKESRAELHIIHIYEDALPYEAGMGTSILKEFDSETETKQLHSMVPADKSVKTSYTLLKGSPAHKILYFANNHNVDLIVMGTHGRHGITRVLIGCVAEDVMRRANCPVITIRTGARQFSDASVTESSSRSR